MKRNYITPMLQINVSFADDLIRTSAAVPDRARFAVGEQGVAEKLEDFIQS